MTFSGKLLITSDLPVLEGTFCTKRNVLIEMIMTAVHHLISPGRFPGLLAWEKQQLEKMKNLDEGRLRIERIVTGLLRKDEDDNCYNLSEESERN